MKTLGARVIIVRRSVCPLLVVALLTACGTGSSSIPASSMPSQGSSSSNQAMGGLHVELDHSLTDSTAKVQIAIQDDSGFLGDFAIYWGDGQAIEERLPLLGCPSQPTTAAPGLRTTRAEEHAFAAPGTYTVKVEISTRGGCERTAVAEQHEETFVLVVE